MMEQKGIREFLCEVIADRDAVENIMTDYYGLGTEPGCKSMEEENGPEIRETFVRYRVLPLIDEKKLAELRELRSNIAEREANSKKERRHVPPKLKTLEDIEALCARNAAKARARKEAGED